MTDRELLEKVMKALEPLAAIEMPHGAEDGLWVARTSFCNNQVTAHSVKQARTAHQQIKERLEKP